MTVKTKISKGFTLIEISIVLVVIGIIVGAILSGQELVQSSKASTIISELTYFTQARENFVEKYKFLPGDVPDPYLSNNFNGYSADDCSSATGLGDGKWTNLKEYDLAWLQLSYSNMIKQKIDFDLCSVGSTGRSPGTHRPRSDITQFDAGYTFLQTVTLDLGGSDVRAYSGVIRIGGKQDSTDSEMQKAMIPIGIHIIIDAKIDEPNTPTSGKYFVNSYCFNAGSRLYEKGMGDSLNCVGNLADKDLGDISL